MAIFSNPNISLASAGDIPAINELLNSAYRGDSSTEGWTSEAHLISGNTRTSGPELENLMQQSGSVFLVYRNEEGKIAGCVNLQQHARGMYLGMFSVSPKLQGGGIGKKILRASEEYARHEECRTIYMSVISLRDELIRWYERHGYRQTGERKPFIEDDVSGKHLQALEFVILEKWLS